MDNKALIERFYTCFKNKDFKGMQDCYSADAQFSDPVFGNLNAKQVKAMWEMLVKSADDLVIDFSNITAAENDATAHWVAEYTFSATGRKVINSIDASFTCMNGKIIKHEDTFSFYNWAKQALGLKGLLLGSTGFLKKTISARAHKRLETFMQKTASK